VFRLATFVDGPEGVAMLERAAAAGCVSAIEAMGHGLATGEGLGQDLAKARSAFRDAALAGRRGATYELGLMCVFGEGGERNVEEGVGWLVRAAALGSMDACHVLADLFERGAEGMPASAAMAATWRVEEKRRRSVPPQHLDPISDLVPLLIRK
jgi:uncharacterized protein